MKKLVSALGVFLIAIFLNVNAARASTEFAVDTIVSYFIQQDGNTNVIYTLRVENTRSEVYSSSYTLILDHTEPQGVVARQLSGKELTTEVRRKDSFTEVEVFFTDPLPGLGKYREFSISYTDTRITKRTGEIWEVSIPRLTNGSQFRKYDVLLRIPQALGNTAFIAPQPKAEEEGTTERRLIFEKEQIETAGISAGFGIFQVFSFALTYHLENPLPKESFIEIALPPDTSTQTLFYDSIEPKPDTVTIDSDGNWLARYTLKPRERFDVRAKGSVQVFAEPYNKRFVSKETLDLNTQPTDYWQSTDPQIAALANNLLTPQAIYNYVITKLTYKTSDSLRHNRLGAKRALQEPNNSICLEFTDLFIALARANGIPAREINGFAYTENPATQPLSLVADVLHSWPEYWDEKRQAWVPIDPTWGSITKGVDYFNKFDLRHFAFVIHGEDPEKPFPPGSYKLGAQPQKDVHVTFGQLPRIRKPSITITAHEQEQIPLTSRHVLLNIENESPFAVYDQEVVIKFGDSEVKKETISVLPPASSFQTTVTIPVGFLGTRAPDTISVSAGGTTISIANNKTQAVIVQLAAVCGVLIVTLLLAHSKLLGGFIKILTGYGKHIKKSNKEKNIKT